uniref:Uncharacterized protein n=1 Tax=Plectus sambesii TaxID=2011161 RepID=A0A914XMI4_9BILA
MNAYDVAGGGHGGRAQPQPPPPPVDWFADSWTHPAWTTSTEAVRQVDDQQDTSEQNKGAHYLRYIRRSNWKLKLIFLSFQAEFDCLIEDIWYLIYCNSNNLLCLFSIFGFNLVMLACFGWLQ